MDDFLTVHSLQKTDSLKQWRENIRKKARRSMQSFGQALNDPTNIFLSTE